MNPVAPFDPGWMALTSSPAPFTTLCIRLYQSMSPPHRFATFFPGLSFTSASVSKHPRIPVPQYATITSAPSSVAFGSSFSLSSSTISFFIPSSTPKLTGTMSASGIVDTLVITAGLASTNTTVLSSALRYSSNSSEPICGTFLK